MSGKEVVKLETKAWRLGERSESPGDKLRKIKSESEVGKRNWKAGKKNKKSEIEVGKKIRSLKPKVSRREEVSKRN